MKIVRAARGEAREVVELQEVRVPDLWHTAMLVREKGYRGEADAIIETWHLTHDLLSNLQALSPNYNPSFTVPL